MPQPKARSNGSGTLADLADWLAGGRGGDTQNDNSSYQITYSPTFQFYGEAPTQEDLVEASRMSQEEFNEMMDEWAKRQGRLSFA